MTPCNSHAGERAQCFGDRSNNIERRLELRVMEYLHGRHIPGLRSVHIKASGSNITIFGVAASAVACRRSTECCRSVAGVMNVSNKLEVALN